MLRHLLFALAVSVLPACSSSLIKIDTNPQGADIFVTLIGQSGRQNVGKTPLVNTKVTDLLKGHSGGPMVIDLEKPGYQNVSILVPETGNGAIEITQQMKSVESAGSPGNSLELNRNLDDLFEAQRLARTGRLDDALKVLDSVGKANPQLSAVPEIRGGIYYLKKDYARSLDEYRKSLAMDEGSASAQRMVRRLETQLGTKTGPAAAPKK